MNSPILRHHWPQRRPMTPMYQLTDRLHDGHIAQVPAHAIAGTISGWLAELGAHSTLVDDLARAVREEDWPSAHALAECLCVEVAIAS